MISVSEGEQAPKMFHRNTFSSVVQQILDASDTAQLNILTKQVPTTSDDNFQIILKQLTSNLVRLDNVHGQALILVVIKYNKWWKLQPRTIEAFKKFLISLCSFSPKWWDEIASVLISQFVKKPSSTTHHHELIRFFLRIIPTSIQSINNTLIINFPNKLGSKYEIVNYVGNLIEFSRYCDDLRFNVWGLIIERSIQIDVQLQSELDELSVEQSDYDSGSESEASEAEDASEDEEEDLDEDEDPEEEDLDVLDDNMDDQQITQLSGKLDSILITILQHLQAQDFSSEESEEDSIVLYNTLVSLFKSHILPTYYTKSIQFIYFYYTQKSPELIDSFLVTLIDLAFNSDSNLERKIKSLQYLASYLARAKGVSKSQLLFVTSYLIGWLNKYVEEREHEISHGNMNRFRLFYSTFQVLLYVFCFKYGELRLDDDEWELKIDQFFQRIIVSKFNPLKFCNENVVLMFAKISQEENLVYCYSILEKIKHEKLKGISGMSSSLHELQKEFIDLEAYFPFDPLFLKQSKRFVSDLFIEWDEVASGFATDSDDFDDM